MRADGVLKEGEKRAPFVEMKAAWESGKYKITPNQNQVIFTETSNFGHLLGLLRARRWLRLVAPPGSAGFITCDHPVSVQWADPRLSYRHPPGFALKDTRVVFPVTHTLVLLGTFDGPDGEAVVDEDFLAAINGSVLVNAAAQIYAPSEDFLYRLLGDEAPKRGDAYLADLAAKKQASA